MWAAGVAAAPSRTEALDKVRKQEYARLSGRNRKFIKGQKYALLSHPENLTGDARRNLKLLLTANKRLNTAYLGLEQQDPRDPTPRLRPA